VPAIVTERKTRFAETESQSAYMRSNDYTVTLTSHFTIYWWIIIQNLVRIWLKF